MRNHGTGVMRAIVPRLMICTAIGLPVASHAREGVDSEVGIVDFAVACSDATQQTMNRAVAQLHNMMYVEAESLFTGAAAAEPDCAMPHWGIAMSNFHPLWPGATSDPEMARGTAAIERALDIGGADSREQAFIDAAAAFYAGAVDTGIPVRIATWADAQKQVRGSFPDDVDAVAFYALAHLAMAPKGDPTFKHQREAGALLETLHAENAEHPAGFHYLIHAYDNPLLASKGEAVSRAYDKLAPDVPHALHMPSHIFVRMGLWNETVFWNDRSAQAALKAATQDVTSMHYAHAIDYKVYAHLQRGEQHLAHAAVHEMQAVANHQDGFAAAYALAASPSRLVLESEDWKAASDLPDALHPSIDWYKFPATVAINHFAQAIGAARVGDLEKAVAAEAKLSVIRDRLEAEGPAYWAMLVDAQLLSAKAWVVNEQGDAVEAESLMREAAEIEDRIGKSPVTPGSVLPARELYGDLLELLGKHDMALSAYEAALSQSPNRARSLRGAMRAAAALGESEKTELYGAALDELLASAAPMKHFVVTLDAASGERLSASQLVAASNTDLHGPEREHGVSMLEEFRSEGAWFLTFAATDIGAVRAYVADLQVEPEGIIESAFVMTPESAGGPKAGAVRDGHKVFMIQRNLPGAGEMPQAVREEVALASQGTIEAIGDGIEWDHSYVTSDGTFCAYRSNDPSLIEEHARMMEIPANPITEVEHIVRDFAFAKVGE